MELWIKLPPSVHIDDLKYDTKKSKYENAIDLEVSGFVKPNDNQLKMYRNNVKKYSRSYANELKKFGPFKAIFHVGNEMDLDSARVKIIEKNKERAEFLE